MFYYIWDFLIDVLENSLFVLVAFSFFKGNNKIKNSYIFGITVSIMSVIEFSINRLELSAVISVLIGLLLRFIIVYLFFDTTQTKVVFLCVIYTILCMIAETISILPTVIAKLDFEEIITIGITRLVVSFLYILILSVLVFSIISFVDKIFILNKSERIFFFLISLISIIIEQILMINLATLSVNDYMYVLTICIFFLTMFLYWGMSFYIYNLGITRTKNLLLEKENLTILLEEKQYERIITSASELRGLRHDFKHHLEAIKSFLDHNEYKQADEYIKSLDARLSHTKYVLSTGNIAIDSIISHELYNANLLGINFNYSIFVPELMPINNPDLCSIFSNLLDNAIEACQKVDGEKNIDFAITPYNNMLSITITNSSCGVYKTDKTGNLLTSKENSNNLHGIGINRVNDIITRYNGFLTIEPAESVFTVRILIPLD